MKGKNNAGFSLIETLVAITVLAIIVVPTCTGMVMSFQMNAKAEQLMLAELAVSSAVEQLMAEGIKEDGGAAVENEYPVDVSIFPAYDKDTACYEVTVKSTNPNANSISVTTQIRNAVPPTAAEQTEGPGGVG